MSRLQHQAGTSPAFLTGTIWDGFFALPTDFPMLQCGERNAIS
jgi:hypothetical protein